ncbi:hypothetical protein [Chryseobacterium takakiae]|uniref:DNA recombination-mediator protein A n=1 Tax=Chryseobacterium takakiae TaxID=1302685 RepID=A0A1M5ATB3_9FLAO|nr:hypothetical protein [Chryseobacterium takakiae]SHF33508.1 hypothetical protein SAMN05444408_11515 [Chryseobacterium takakiae]
MILGITGHQDLKSFNLDWIKFTVNNFLKENDIIKGLSSLAIGSDQLFCRQLIKKNIPYDVIIPCDNYISTFKTLKDSESFLGLLNMSKGIYTLNFDKPSESAFYSAGIEIVNKASVIIAIWDGKPAKGLGGTGDIVKIALQQKKSVYHINPVNEQSKYLISP